jgi:cell fate regulator YaaT (PSP1 superfamily)
MPVCVGVAFKRVAKSYWFDPGELELNEEDRVVVETTRGLEMGIVKIPPCSVAEEDILNPLKRVLRIAQERDYEEESRNKERAKQALSVCLERVKSHELPMKLLQAEFNFDGSQVTVYFSSESRVDFRELVRDIATQLRCKVLLHQVGARDQAKMIGGVGPCGLTLCCASFLTEFAPISMKMAKDQSLFLNPVKFSGVCGKLMCCLRYEHETYVDAKKRLPLIGDVVISTKGQGKVVDLNLLKETAVVQLMESKAEIEVPAGELRVEKTARCANCRERGADQLEEDAEDAETVDAETRAGAEEIARRRAAEMEN